MKTTKCEACEREIKNCNVKKHINVCKGKKSIFKISSCITVGDKYQCPFCDKIFVKSGIGGHIWKSHNEFGKLHKRVFKPGEKSWNAGLSKETNKIVKQQGEALKEKYKSGKLKHYLSGKTRTEEEKERISKARLKYLNENPDKVPYLLNHSSKESYPEKVFRNALVENKIEYWIQEYQNGIYRYDFAFIDLKIDVEIDGSTHLTEKVKKIDERRDNWSKEQGWIVVRFTAKEIKENVTRCINILKEVIKGLE